MGAAKLIPRLALLVLAAGMLPASAQADAPPTVESWALDAGTEIALVEDHRAPLVRLMLVFPAGEWSPWVRESHAKEGFEIQLHDPGNELRRRADLLSASLSVAVGDRSSTLSVACLRQDLAPMLDLVRDVLANREFDRSELKRRKRSAKIGWEASLRNPWFRGAQEAARALFAGDDPRRLAWEEPVPPEKDSERLAAARDQLIRLPGRLIAFAGAVSRSEVERLAEGLLPPVVPESPGELEPDLRPMTPLEARSPLISVRLPRLTQVYFGYGRDSLPETDDDYPAFLVADHVLGGHFYSRLYVALRHEGGETYGAFSANLGDAVVGPYGLGTFTRVPNAAATEAKLREVLRLFHAQGITEDERVEAVGWLEGRRPFSRQSPFQVLDRWLRDRNLGLPEGFSDALVDRAAALDLRQINEAISRYFDPAGFTMIRVEPK